MKCMFIRLCFLFFMLSNFLIYAQKETITGMVSDESGPLPGVSVLIKGTTTGTETDFDGKYSIEAEIGDVLVFSFVGLKTQEIAVSNNKVINVILQNDSILEEVVVVAYGTQKEESIVGSIASIDTETIEKQQVTSVTNAIQGSVPGVNIISEGGVPGDNPTIRIRGVGSINASADPLIIVDGAPFNGNINSISQDQIESINVLKDASSTALYGSRAANGVILITTKSGRLNTAPTLNVTSSYGFTKNAVAFHKLVGAEDYMKYSWEALRNADQYINGNDAVTAGQNATANLISELQYNPYGVNNPIDSNGNLISNANLLWDTDWSDALLRNSGTRMEHGFSISGGGEKTTYFASTNYLKEDGNVKNTHFERVTSRLKLDSEITEWLTLGANISYSISNSNVPSQSGTTFQSAVQWMYTVPNIYPVYRRDVNGALIYDDKGQLIYDYGNNAQSVNGNRPIFGGENGVGALYNYKLRYKRYNTTLSGYAEIKFSDNLKFKTSLSHENYLYDFYNYVSNEFGYAANVNGRVTQNRDITQTLNAIQSLNFNKSFDKHNLNVDLIYEAYRFNYDQLGAQGVGFLPNVEVLDGSTTPELVSGSFTDETLNSYLTRVSYNFDSKYFVEGSFRRDGSSRFSKDNRWGDFYSVGASWLVSKERFLENSQVVSLLKLKASYGELGNNKVLRNDGTADYFPYYSIFETGWNNLNNPGVLLAGVVDPNIKWEKTSSLNLGVEFGLFNDRLYGSVEYYERKSVDLIYDLPLPISTGDDGVLTNVASLKNSGIEVTLNGSIFQSEDFNWDAGVNFSMDKNEITDLPQDEFLNGTKLWRVGKSLYDFYVREYAGVDPDDGYAMWYQDVLDSNGNPTGERTTTKVYGDATRYYIGKSSLPDILGGFNTTIQYKNWDLSALLNFSFGGYILDGTYQSLMNSLESLGRQVHADIANRWQKPGDITDVPLLLASNNDFNATSSRFIFKNDYVRVRALTLGYNFDKEVVERIGMKGLRLYFQADNPFTYQSHKGIDPEQNLAGTTNSRSYQQKIFSFGVKLKF
ncbi:MAG: TonB-dependent receptor [Flavobacteriaceae bacterium]|nr:TonB-dependent receptor [Flavobacteriaceae bacterium]